MDSGLLCERIRYGDVAAFDDPALLLHLLAEPGAAWWWEGLAALAHDALADAATSLVASPTPWPEVYAAVSVWIGGRAGDDFLLRDRLRDAVSDGARKRALISLPYELLEDSDTAIDAWTCRQCIALARLLEELADRHVSVPLSLGERRTATQQRRWDLLKLYHVGEEGNAHGRI